ncbi:MAG: thiamine pyrophosphate-dependent enzyme [Acidimicrobiia bacterium]
MTLTDTQLPTRSDLGYDQLRPLMSLMSGDEKHTEAATSTLDVVWTLYDRVLDVDPSDPTAEDRDRFYLSKGHGPMAYFAVLAAKRLIPISDLDGFGSWNSPLGHHPDRTLVDGVEVSSGSLGHGLPLAVGAALGMRLKKTPGHVFVLLGDGELDEGSNHEAIAAAARLRLGGLTAIVIDNNSAHLGWPGGIETRFRTEGWTATTVNGRDHDEIEAAVVNPSGGVPHAVIARVGSY